MTQEKQKNNSAVRALQEETLVSDTAIQEFQEDARQAEKERLQSSQKRGRLLGALRKSMKQAGQAAGAREGIQQEFTRAIQEGSPEDIGRSIILYQKQINGLQSKAMISSQTNGMIREFFDRANVFLEKKKMLEKVETTINSLCFSVRGETSVESNLNKLTDVTKALRADLLSLMGRIVEQIESMEFLIAEDLIKEEKLRALFYTCLSSVDEQRKAKIIFLSHKKTQGASYSNRLHFFKTLVEQLTKADGRVAKRVHSHIRKEARSFQKKGQYKKAISELCYALHLWKDNVYTYRLLAELFYHLKDEKNAYIALGEILRLCPDDSRLRKRMAEYYTRRKLLPKAIHEYQILHENDPTNLSFRRELGWLLYESKLFRQAVEVLAGCIRLMPEDVVCLNCLGNSFLHLNDWESAVYYLRESVEVNKQQPEAYQSLALAFRKLEFYGQAIHALNEGIQENPGSLSLKILLGTVYLDCDMNDQVLKTLQPVLKTHPDSPSLLTTIGQAHYSMGHIDEAISMLNQSYQIKNDDANTLVMLARSYQKKGDCKTAQDFFEQSLQTDRKNVNLQQELASFYIACGQWQKATELLKKNHE